MKNKIITEPVCYEYDTAWFQVSVNATEHGSCVLGTWIADGSPAFELNLDHEGLLHHPTKPSIIKYGKVCETTDYYNKIRFLKQPLWTTNAYTWYKHGLIHNEHGPAYVCRDKEWVDIPEQYYLNGRVLTEKQWFKKTKPDEWKREQLKKPVYIAGAKYKISSIANDKIILELLK